MHISRAVVNDVVKAGDAWLKVPQSSSRRYGEGLLWRLAGGSGGSLGF